MSKITWSYALKVIVYMEKNCFGLKDHSPTRAQYLGRANFAFISVQNLANRLHENKELPRLKG